jgi:hypothetical protein
VEALFYIPMIPLSYMHRMLSSAVIVIFFSALSHDLDFW